jgi:macrolide transport system ATP-binding/permease protein
MSHLFHDLRYSLRQMRRNPTFSAIAVLTLALGIGGNTAIFSVVEAVLLRPLSGIQEPGRLASLYRMQKNNEYGSMGYPDYADFRDRNTSFSGLAAFALVSLSVSRGTPERMIGSVVTGNYFSVLGVQPAIGRLILPADDTERHGNPVAVLSYGLWTRKFGADPGAVGGTIVMNGYPFTIIGVAPRAFGGTLAGYSMQVWTPMSMLAEAMPGSAGRHYFDERAWGWLNVFGRLKPGVRAEQAEAEMKGIAAQIALAHPNTNAGRTVAVTEGVGIDPDDRAGLRSFLSLLFAGVGLLLLIACANVAGMLLVRATGRQREIAVRLALGASRAQLARQWLTESLLLSLPGGLLGLAIAPWAVKLAVSLAQPATVIRRADLSPDARVLLFTLLVSVLTGILAVLAPVLRAPSTDLTKSLKQGAPGSGRPHSHLQSLLVVGQVALSFVLMMATGLLARSMRRILTADPGFKMKNVFLARIDLTEQGSSNSSRGAAARLRDQDGAPEQAGRGEMFYRQLFDRLQTIQGAVSASVASSVPPDEWPGAGSVFHPGDEPPQEVLRGNEFHLGTRVNIVVVTPNYFRTLGISLLQGRDFTSHDDSGGPSVAIVSRNLAERFWPGDGAVGKPLSWPTLMGPPRAPLTVVGVVADCRYRSLVGDAPLLMYVPLFQNYSRSTTILVRTASSPSGVLAPVRREVSSLDKSLPVFGISTMQEQANLSLWQQRMAVYLISVFGALALFLAGLGLYGVMAHSVAQRTNEIGIRMALGAKHGDLLKLVTGRAFEMVVAGVAIGIVGELALKRLLSGLLYGVSSADVSTFIVISILQAAVGLLASYIPARRATKVDPVVALRFE